MGAEIPTIRPFGADDYEGWAALNNEVYPDHPTTAEEVRYYDGIGLERYRRAKFVAVDGERIVGTASFDQVPWMYHPRKFSMNAIVAPHHRRRGLGSALYERLLLELRRFDPLALRVSVRESSPEGLSFVGARGFVEERRTWVSELDLGSFDATRFAGAEERATRTGIGIKTLAELSREDPDWRRKYFELGIEAGKDVPRPDAYTYPTFEEYGKIHFESPSFLADGSFVAVDGGKYVGLSDLEDKGDADTIDTGFTGVLREYRGLGIALALKLRAIEYARKRGAKRLTTGNDSNNQRMLAINDALGFKRTPAWIGFVKRLKEEER
jgi:GNAT superfamily N-acetyltransferase